MPRTGKRITIETGIYRDGPEGAYEVRAIVGGHPYSEWMPKDSTRDELRNKRDELKRRGRTETPRTERGTLRADATRYLSMMKHLASWEDREDHLNAWIELLGDTYRHRITTDDVRKARVRWLQKGRKHVRGKRQREVWVKLSPKTVNHYVGTLRHLYRTLDGKRAPTPCDDIDPLPVAKTPIERVSDELILDIDRRLQAMEARRDAPPWDAKTRARFRVLVSTGKRPIEVMRAVRGDVNFEQRVWVPRDAKGGFCPGVYLNDDMLAAWRLFDEANAWGTYHLGNFARTIRSAGWPAKVRPYNARHTTWITASERGIDLEDISVGAGHKDPRMTRRAYVPVLNSRLQRMSETLDGRFGGWNVVPDRGGEAK